MDRRLIILGAFAAVLAAIVVVVLVAGGGDDEGDGPETADPGTKPVLEAPGGEPPTELEVEDIEEGDGAEVSAGDRIGVEYVGVDFDSGEEFDSSWEQPGPFEFTLGGGEVIPGWDQGVEGMKVGGRRRLLIPPELAYGPEGQPPDIKPNATLVFVIDLVSAGS